MNSVTLDVVASKSVVGEPWIWRLSRDFNAQVNIVRANVDEDYGVLQLELTGPLEEIQRATTWLMTTGLHVEARQRALGA